MMDNMPDIPTFMLRGHPDCVAKPVEVAPVRKRSPEAIARQINRECAEMLARHHKKVLAKSRKDRKARKIKKKHDAVLPEHRY